MNDTEPNDTHSTQPGTSPVNDHDETEADLSNDGGERAGDRVVEDVFATGNCSPDLGSRMTNS